MAETSAARKQANAKWRAKHPDYMKEYATRRRTEPGWKWRRHVFNRYGLTPSQWDAMLIEQGGRCEVCAEPMSTTVCVDHDHLTGKVRSLLCPGCNSALGHVERPGWLEQATAYLESHP